MKRRKQLFVMMEAKSYRSMSRAASSHLGRLEENPQRIGKTEKNETTGEERRARKLHSALTVSVHHQRVEGDTTLR